MNNVIMLSVVMMNVVMLTVVAPFTLGISILSNAQSGALLSDIFLQGFVANIRRGLKKPAKDKHTSLSGQIIKAEEHQLIIQTLGDKFTKPHTAYL